ncbi:MAG TPA: RNA polymerase sigma factor [Candidatus Sulfopaludibacter sp.]|jgi:RNA polymerase sigma-70 factor (ECF subfamily)|nr:RNA polymerase sigma factor [Candidatus Sulfopaludibacter sp.]
MEQTSTSGLVISVAPSPAEIDDFDEVVRVYWPRVFRFALASLRDYDAAQTVAQDCFYKAHKNRSTFRGDSSLSTWLMQIAVNTVRDHLRNRRLQFWKRSQSIDPAARWIPDGQLSPENEAALRERVQTVWRVAETLSEKQRTVFLLRFVDDMDLLEIAAATGMKEGTVKTHLFRALQTIREQLGDRNEPLV